MYSLYYEHGFAGGAICRVMNIGHVVLGGKLSLYNAQWNKGLCVITIIYRD